MDINPPVVCIKLDCPNDVRFENWQAFGSSHIEHDYKKLQTFVEMINQNLNVIIS
jgi:hypothetical protein